MDKIYYYQKEVKLGDTIEVNGIKLTITQELIDNNFDKFIVKKEVPEYVECIRHSKKYKEYTVGKIYPVEKGRVRTDNGYLGQNKLPSDLKNHYNNTDFKPSTKEAFTRQEFLKEANNKYSVGDKVINVVDFHSSWVIKGKLMWYNNRIVDSSNYCTIYDNYSCKWATIIDPLFTTSDGVKIYPNEGCWGVYIKEFPIGKYETNHIYSGIGVKKKPDPAWFKTFSTMDAAIDYIKTLNLKTLEGYENELLKTPKDINLRDYTHSAWTENHFAWLKDTFPKLYYTHILQLIADNLNEGWKPDFNDNNIKYSIQKYAKKVEIYSGIYTERGTAYFKSKRLAQKAIEIMGDKIHLIFD